MMHPPARLAPYAAGLPLWRWKRGVSAMPEPSRSSSFAADVLKLVTGTTIAQLITRLYGPEVFGFSLPRSPASSGLSPACATSSAIMLPKTDLPGLCLLCVAVVERPLYFGGDALLSLPGGVLVLPVVFMGGVVFALNYWNLRTKHPGGSRGCPGHQFACYNRQMGAHF